MNIEEILGQLKSLGFKIAEEGEFREDFKNYKVTLTNVRDYQTEDIKDLHVSLLVSKEGYGKHTNYIGTFGGSKNRFNFNMTTKTIVEFLEKVNKIHSGMSLSEIYDSDRIDVDIQGLEEQYMEYRTHLDSLLRTLLNLSKKKLNEQQNEVFQAYWGKFEPSLEIAKSFHDKFVDRNKRFYEVKNEKTKISNELYALKKSLEK